MDLYIEMRNGEPINHPYVGSNLRECGIDTNDLPTRFLPFKRHSPPRGLENVPPVYVVRDGFVEDHWILDHDTREKMRQFKQREKEARFVDERLRAQLRRAGFAPDVV